MLGIELQQTRVYRDAFAEGEVRGLERGLQQERGLVLKLLNRKLGNINPEIQARVGSLTIEQIESLGEDLLDFTSLANLEGWLSQNLS
jgi:predicted transposase YdaD